MLAYYFRNVDPLNGNGQFCDRGHSYIPAIFYQDESEKLIAEKAIKEIEASHPAWGKLAIELLPRSTFWRAEE